MKPEDAKSEKPSPIGPLTRELTAEEVAELRDKWKRGMTDQWEKRDRFRVIDR